MEGRWLSVLHSPTSTTFALFFSFACSPLPVVGVGVAKRVVIQLYRLYDAVLHTERHRIHSILVYVIISILCIELYLSNSTFLPSLVESYRTRFNLLLTQTDTRHQIREDHSNTFGAYNRQELVAIIGERRTVHIFLLDIKQLGITLSHI